MTSTHMKPRILCLTALLLALCGCSGADPDGGETPPEETAESYDLGDYRIVYSADAEDEEGKEIADYVVETVKKRKGKTLSAVTDAAGEAKHEILIGRTSRAASAAAYSSSPGIFQYAVSCSDGKIVLSGGGCWALRKAASLLSSLYLEEGASKSGTIYGEFLFPREDGTDLRILDDNVWQYDSETNAPVWEAAGANCTNAVRVVGFAGLMLAYLPDVICLQEYSKAMDGYLGSRLEAKGYKKAVTDASTWNYTPVWYNSGTLSLDNSKFHVYTPSTWSNSGTKSFSSAVFTHKQTGKRFAVISTHLWWKSESAQEGSNAARESQARELLEEARSVKSSWDCPVFLTGDMNCNLNSNAMKILTAENFVPAWDAATVYGDRRNGHHTCSSSGFSRASNLSDDGYGAIDQFFVWNKGESELKTFWRIQPWFTVLLTDHYPNYADIRL